MDLAVRRLVLILSYIKLLVKIIFFPLLWKICIDFEETVRYKESEFYQNKIKKTDQTKRDQANVHYAEFADSEMGDDRHIYDNI